MIVPHEPFLVLLEPITRVGLKPVVTLLVLPNTISIPLGRVHPVRVLFLQKIRADHPRRKSLLSPMI